MHKPEYVLENEVHEILYDFELQKDHTIPGRRAVLINKKKKDLLYNGLCYTNRLYSESESERRKAKQISGPSQRTEKAVGYVGNRDFNNNYCPWKISQETWKETGGKLRLEEELKPSKIQHY